jgi:hypothetical protein
MSDKGKEWWLERLKEKVKSNPQIRLEELKDYIQILGRRIVENVWKARARKQK